MQKLPEDLRVAIEGMRLLNEKFVAPFSRLEQVLRVCAESYERIGAAESRLKQVQQEIEQSQQKALQQAERAQDRLKAMAEQLSRLQEQRVQEEQAQEQKRLVAQKELEQITLAHAARCREHDALVQDVAQETERLQELRERIRKAQTMEL